MSSVIPLLSTSLGQRDEEANIALAELIAKNKNATAVSELIDTLKDKKLQNDCIKVLYEVGERNTVLIEPHLPVFLELLQSKNNRLQWGAMTAIYCISKTNPEEVYTALPKIVAAADSGSVITTDNAVNILIQLAGNPNYADEAFPLLLERLMKSPTNQLPMYAEKSMHLVNAANKNRFVEILTFRLPEIEKDSKKKRVEKVLKKIGYLDSAP